MGNNKLLEKQIRKYLRGDCPGGQEMALFLEAVNNSYNAFEKDLVLSAHAFRISEQDYEGINQRLNEEINTRRLGVKNLKEAIRRLDDSVGWDNDPGDDPAIEED
jgi:hypothetical protein